MVVLIAFAYLVAALILLLLVLFAYTGLRHLTRGTPIERVRFVGDQQRAGARPHSRFGLLARTHLNAVFHLGNQIQILFDGDQTYPQLFEDLRNAQEVITWHVFWYKPGQLAEQVKEILKERARAGVQVLFLYDAFGSLGISQSYYDELSEAGVEVAVYRPLSFNELYKFQQRSHMRTVVIDGRIGYTGGFAIADEWLGNGRQPDQFRETSARVRGPVVQQLQAAFAEDWIEASGEMLFGEALFPAEPEQFKDGHQAALINGKPTLGSTVTERLFTLSIASAEQTLYITNAYFIPNATFRQLLAEAAARGVDVRILIPGEQTDNKATYYAGRAHLEEILESGVRVYDYQPTMVHAKTMVVDEIWSAVGTANFDNRSLALNNEVVLVIDSKEVGRQLQAKFLEDLDYARELSVEELKSRGWMPRIKEKASLLVSRIL